MSNHDFDPFDLDYDHFGRPPFVIAFRGPRRDEDLIRHDPPWTKAEHPYTYDPFTIWGAAAPSDECNGTVYTDRLSEWDYAKYNRLARKHYRRGDYNYARPFDTHQCKGNLIEEFLRDWFDDPKLRLLRVIEYCNPGTGFQTWRLDYVSTREDHCLPFPDTARVKRETR